jgi:ParB-like chromosome segregation protein Spo0J
MLVAWGGGLTGGKMQIEKIQTKKLIPYANNARTHTDDQVAQIAASIRAFGFNNPVLVDEKLTIIAGHGRVLAAGVLDIEEIPCVKLAHLSENQKKAYILADNKIALNAGWDIQLLKLELETLDVADLKLTGFSDSEIKGFFSDDDIKEDYENNENGNFEIIVECVSEYDQRTLLEKLNAQGYKCKSMLR